MRPADLMPDVEKVTSNEVAPLAEQYRFLKDTIDATEVTDEESNKTAGDLRAKVNALINAAEAKRKSITDPLEQRKKAIIGLFKKPVEMITELLTELDGKIIPYQREQARAKEAAARAAREAELAALKKQQEELEAKASADAAEHAQVDEVTGMTITPAEPSVFQAMADNVAEAQEQLALAPIATGKTVTGSEAKTTLRFTLKARVIGSDIVPRVLCSPDEAKIKKHVSVNEVLILDGAVEQPGDNPAEVVIKNKNYRVDGLEFYKDFSLASKRVFK